MCFHNFPWNSPIQSVSLLSIKSVIQHRGPLQSRQSKFWWVASRSLKLLKSSLTNQIADGVFSTNQVIGRARPFPPLKAATRVYTELWLVNCGTLQSADWLFDACGFSRCKTALSKAISSQTSLSNEEILWWLASLYYNYCIRFFGVY